MMPFKMWIDPAEQKPSDSREVIVCTPDGVVLTNAHYYASGDMWLVHGETGRVAYWTEIPKPPKELVKHER